MFLGHVAYMIHVVYVHG